LSSHPPLGLIEGFFGPPWPEAERLAFAPFLQQNDFQFYIYAPKAQPFLRKRWQEPWPADFTATLKNLSQHFRSHKVQFGVGLSPFELHKLDPAKGKQELQSKLRQLDEIGLDVLGLFFDDMPVHEGMAAAQLEAIETVRQATKAKIIFCPAFYTPDPILEKVFGRRPEKYWDEIKAAPKEIDFAWTGPKVISEEIPLEHLYETADLLGRRPFLWDNLYANDGPRNCKFLKIRPPISRTRPALEACSGWAWNPMNQAALSRLVMLGARHSVLDRTAPSFALEQAMQESCPPSLANFVSRHRQEMLEKGLDKIEPEKKEEWSRALKEWADHPVAREIDDWLAEKYVVGNECLTD
jgi:hypothetical protein